MTEPDANRPGSVLRAEREALGVTLREVAETLNLSITMIEAIEEDDLERLPGPVFARGYVRAYARLLELDPKPLLAHYPKAQDPLPPEESPSEPPVWEWIRRRPALVLGGAGGALLALLVLGVALLWPDGAAELDRELPEPAAQATAPGSAVEADAAEEADAAAEPDAIEPVADVLTDSGAAAPARSEPIEAAPPGTDAAERSELVTSAAPAPGLEPAAAQTDLTDTPAVGSSASAVAPESAAGARRITEAGEDRLSFAFSDDCWVEVRNASGASLYSDLNRAGSELDLVGQGPFRILLGYAPGARLTFNGEPVPLAPHTRNNVATLVLGQ